jgi:hypothetical protein
MTTEKQLKDKVTPDYDKCCIWEYEQDFEYYDTTCDNNFHFIDGNCKENKFLYCPYCGRVIIEILKEDV